MFICRKCGWVHFMLSKRIIHPSVSILGNLKNQITCECKILGSPLLYHDYKFLQFNFEGYGREYRERLYGKWGIVDVDDCCSCAKYLVSNIFLSTCL